MMAKKILVVDDNDAFCEVLRDFLASKGFGVAEAYSGEEALAAFRRDRPDVVLLDMRMPGMDGMETLRCLKALDPDVAVTMLTGVFDEEVVSQAEAEGCQYLTKPIDLSTLLEAILKVCSSGGDE